MKNTKRFARKPRNSGRRQPDMDRQRKPEEHTNRERWLVSYADFITLLFAFFVVMFASSYSDDKKIGKVSQAVQSAFKELAVFEPSSKNVPLFTGGGLPNSDRDTGSAMAALTEKELVELVARNSDIQKIKAQLE